MQGWTGSCRGGVGCAGVGWVMQEWGRSCRVGGSCRGEDGSCRGGVQWVM